MARRKHASKATVTKSLKDLGKALKQKKSEATGATPEIKAVTPPNDEEVFRDAMNEVQEIREFRQIPIYYKKRNETVYKKKNGLKSDAGLKGLEEIVRGKRQITLSHTQEYVEWVNPQCRDDVIPDLHEGRYAVQDSLDIHGLILDEAEIEVERFIKDSLRNRCRCIKIIHGRGLRSPGGPVLKTAVTKWLSGRLRKHVMAFVSARQCDGGLGALYILLR